MGNYASRTGNPELVVTVQPYNDNKARKAIVLTETTVDCLRNKIIEAFGEDQDSTLHIYYRILRKSVNDQSRYLLSRNANLVDIFYEVETLPEKQKQLLFEYNSLFVVVISSKHSAQPDVVVELEKVDIVAELKEMIVEHFGVSTNVCIYYQNSETDAKTIIKNEKSLKLGLINSGHVFFEPLETKTIPDEVKLSTSTAISTLTQRDAKSYKDSGLFISYNWSTKQNVNAVVDKLSVLKPDLPIWRDTEKMESDIYNSMGSGIAGCQVVVACFSLGYLESPNCMLELGFAQDLRKPIIPVFFFEEGEDITTLRQKYSKAFLIIAGKKYSDFKRWDALDSNWEAAFDNFVKEVECALNKVAPSAVVVPKSPLEVWLVPESFDADLEAYALEYVPGTRLWIVPALQAWTRTKERVMYLNGGAGTGKSLIVYSLTKNLPGNFVIGALFICRYNNVRKSDPIVLVSTIVSSLCLSLGGAYKQYVEAEMEEDHARVKDKKQSLLKTPVDAFKVLVVDGLKKLSVPEWKTKTLLIVIDALDELNKDTRHSVLKILTTLCPELPGFVKIVTTGRPERDIYYALQELSPFVLSPGDNNNAADLKVFVKYRLQALWGVILQGTDAEKCCEALLEKADGLFIYARNVCEYIKKQNLDPKQALVDIQALTSGSDGVYRAIVERELQTNRAERLAQFKCVFAVLFAAQRPLTLMSLANIGGLDIRDVESVVSEFRSILKIEHGGIVSAIHKSVKDFFTDFTRCGGELFIQAVDASLAVCCLQILIANLSHNMAHLDPTKFYSKDELAQLTVLNEDLLYAVLFWASHFKLGFPNALVEDQQVIIKLLYQFCTTILPYYLEALLLLSKLNEVFPMVQSVSDTLSHFTHMEEVKTVLSLLNDLKFVAVNFRTQLLASPLQVYNHALISVPQETVYFRLYQSLASAHIIIGAEKEWSSFTLIGHSLCVGPVAYSPDNKTVVSGSWDKTVKLWSLETGECVKTLEGHSGSVNSVAFLPDGKSVVSGSGDNTVKLWSLETGECVKTLEGHFRWVASVAYSPDGKTVVSGSGDDTVKVWSVETRKLSKTLAETGECLETSDWYGRDLNGTFSRSELTAHDGWVCADKTLLYFIGKPYYAFFESSVSWRVGTDVVCLVLKH